MPELPNAHAAVMMGVTLFALVMFSREKIPLQTSSLSILALIVVLFELWPFEYEGEPLESSSFFSGFGHEALIAVAALMICGQGLVTTGALLPVGRAIARLWRTSPSLSMLLTLVFGAAGSAFVNNTPIVVLLIPILANVAARNNTSAAPWLMPMNFSTLLGGASTTIGTSTNLLVVAVAVDLGLREFGMFDFALPAVIAGGVGMVYLWLIAPRLLRPDSQNRSTVLRRDFVFQLEFAEDSQSVGRTLAELTALADGTLEILRLRKAGMGDKRQGTAPLPDIAIGPGDRITASGKADDIPELERLLDAFLVGNADDDPDDAEVELAQVVVMENSALVGRTLAQSHFAASFGVEVFGIHRATGSLQRLPGGIGNVAIQTGDILLLQGSADEIEDIKNVRSLLILDERRQMPMLEKGRLAILILLGVVAAAATGVLPIAASALVGALLMLLTRCIDWRDVGDALSIPVIMIVVVSLALGSALTQTGATEYIAQVFLHLLEGASATVVLSALILLMATLTNIVSNNAAAVIGTPIAISMASALGAPPETFVLAVLFGANLSFVTPMAYKTNVLVMSAGDYSFGDFVRVGLPLTVILWLTYSLILPRIFGI